MELRDVLKRMRIELGMSQTEFANAMHVNYATVNRWEAGRTCPNQSIMAALVQFAHTRCLSKECTEMLKASINDIRREKISHSKDKFFNVEHASLGQLIDDAAYPIYVCDMETDDLLYINHECEKLLGGRLEELKSRKCYTCLMDRESPCQFCHKDELRSDRLTTFHAFRPDNNTYHIVQAKLIQWNGKKAHVRYIVNFGSAQDVSDQSMRESAYEQQLSLRRELAGDAIAVAHFNLTRDTVSDVVCSLVEYEKLLLSYSLDDLLFRIKNDIFLDEDMLEIESICDRKVMIQSFYEGKTHITFRHYIPSMDGIFQGTFDLMQNPVTYDIEAFAQLHNVTHQAVQAEITRRLCEMDYESITAIDADTGEAHPYFGSHIYDVIEEQKRVGDNVSGVEAYLRKYCADEDVEHVIIGTSLSYVKQQLAENPSYQITYSLRLGEKTIYKRVIYSWLDRMHKIILCAMQDLTELHVIEDKKRNQMAEALQTLQEQCGMDIGRYDLKTQIFYSNSAMMSAVGYGGKIENVPEEFIQKGLLAPDCVEPYREYFAKLRQGKAETLFFQAKVGDGSLHWIQMDSQLLRHPNGEPYQALLAFTDIDDKVPQANVYKKWRQKLDQKKPEDYSLFRCNLSEDASLDKTEGTLLRISFTPEARTFNDRTKEYAGRFVHIEDFAAYTKLINAENLIAAYYRGTYTAALDYRERVSVDYYQWLRVTVDLAQYPGSPDVEAFLMFERADDVLRDAAHSETLHAAASKKTGVMVVNYDWNTQQFTYDPSMSEYLLGRYDERPLWEILMTDGVMDTQDLKLMRDTVRRLAETPGTTNVVLELMMKTPSGADHWFNFFALKQLDAANGAVNIIMTFLDVNEDMQSNRQLRFMAEHDSLTGLFNRDSFLKLVSTTVKSSPADSYVLVCSDISDFGFFNNRYGREEGDKLLKYSAEKLRSYIVAKDGFAGRMSNDIFAFLLPNSEGLLERIKAVVRNFFADYPMKVKLSGRAGVCLITDPGMKADSMLDRAVIAKDSIKGKYDRWVALYNEGLNERKLKEKYITDRMENALAEGQFDVYIQPQFHHATGRIVGAEALVRWIDPERGVISPGEFIPMFEKNGFITRLDEFVWERTAQYINEWMKNGAQLVPISVNISREDTNDPNLCKKLKAIVDKYCIPSSFYRLEITESLFAEDTQRIAAVVDELHEAGFLVEMDDFGSGYSSLNILKDVPVDILKMDMRFFSGNDNLGRGGMIINAVLRMSRWLNVPVIAEGVELKDQADFLLSVGCSTIQGYLYERPMPATAFEKLLSGDLTKRDLPQNIIDTELDVHSFWNPSSADSQVFNNYIGPAVIFEYHDGNYEVVRMNLRFTEFMHVSESGGGFVAGNFVNICQEDKAKFNKAVVDVIYLGKDVRTSVNCEDSSGTKRVINFTLRSIARSAERALIFAALDA